MRIIVIDGQGGGIGRSLVELLVKNFPDAEIGATGTNSIATETMLKGGPSFAATGENAILFNAAEADVIIGPAGIIMANALHGEISHRHGSFLQQSKGRAHSHEPLPCIHRRSGREKSSGISAGRNRHYPANYERRRKVKKLCRQSSLQG